MSESKFICPFCGKESTLICRIEGNAVLHECSVCGSLVGAYWKEKYKELISLHNKRLDRFKVAPPEWVRRVESEQR